MSFSRRTPLHCLLAALSFLPAGCAPVQVRTPAQAPVREHAIQGGESQSITLEVAAGQFLGLVVEQGRVDVVVELFDPEKKMVMATDSPDDWFWEEELAWVAERSGTHRIVVRPYHDDAAPERYRLRMDGPRALRPGDQVRLEAVREMVAAHALIENKEREAERLGHLERALPLWQDLGERRREAEVLHQMGGRLFELDRQEESAERFHRAAAIWESLGLPDRRVWSLLEAGHVDQMLLREEESLGHLEEGLAFARKTGIRELEVQALYLLGRFHEKSPRAAAGYLESALRLARELGNGLVEMRALHYLGYSYGELAEHQEALRYYEGALALTRRRQERGLEAATLNNIGLLYDDLGDTERALRFYEQALGVSDKLEDISYATALNNQARTLERLDPVRARELYERTLALCEKIGARELRATALNNLALLDLSTGNPSSALRRSLEALQLAAGYQDVEIDVRRALGIAHLRLGDLDSSRRELEAALALSRERQDRVRESQVIAVLARTERSAGDPRRALELLEEGVDILEGSAPRSWRWSCGRASSPPGRTSTSSARTRSWLSTARIRTRASMRWRCARTSRPAPAA